jgi:formylglycine-generating enzyme required for sulfatase activity
MMPGHHPVKMLAVALAHAFGAEAADVLKLLEDKSAKSPLALWLLSRKASDTAFLLAIDQFEELFTFADLEERNRFDLLLADALRDPDCPLYVVSTVRADFLDQFEDLKALGNLRNGPCKQWALLPIGSDRLKEVIAGPAALAGLDVSEVQDAILDDAQDEPGALPLVENALRWLWENRKDSRLSGQQFRDAGKLAGILSRNADALIERSGNDRALNLLFRLVKVDPEGRRHTRRCISREDAADAAGGGKSGQGVVESLAGVRRQDDPGRRGQLRLITIAEDNSVNLIHETLVRAKGPDAAGKLRPYWPTLWNHVERQKQLAPRRDRLELLVQEWQGRRGLARIFGLASWSDLSRFRGLASRRVERRYLHWSAASAAVQAVLLAGILGAFGLAGEGVYWANSHGYHLDLLPKRWAYKLGLYLPLPELKKIPGGSFMMGDDKSDNSDEKPAHPVTFARLPNFATTEVTFEQYDMFAIATGRELPADGGWGRDDRPVIDVYWSDADAYAKWLTKVTGNSCHLPSEAGWEYACRAGTTTEYALPAETNGSEDIGGKGLANCYGCGSTWDAQSSAPAGSFKANAFGLYDMHGNVWEWVQDCYNKGYFGAPADGQALADASDSDCWHVLRGGSWSDGAVVLRCAVRNYYGPDVRFDYVGFRVVCSSPSF